MQIEPNLQDEITSELKFDEGKTLIYINVLAGRKNIYCQKTYGFSADGCTSVYYYDCNDSFIIVTNVSYCS